MRYAENDRSLNHAKVCKCLYQPRSAGAAIDGRGELASGVEEMSLGAGECAPHIPAMWALHNGSPK